MAEVTIIDFSYLLTSQRQAPVFESRFKAEASHRKAKKEHSTLQYRDQLLKVNHVQPPLKSFMENIYAATIMCPEALSRERQDTFQVTDSLTCL